MEKSNIKLDGSYWDQRYQEDNTGWDIGYANKALVEYVLTSVSKDTRILIPGAGNAYELESIWKAGYTNAFAMDLSPTAKTNFLNRVSDFPAENYLLGDFFESDLRFDVVLEQTFFCALDPTLRSKYVEHMHKMLSNNGVIAGVLFNFEKPIGPPFGGSEEEYRMLFTDLFEIKTMEECRNSIEQRQGNELFIELIKK